MPLPVKRGKIHEYLELIFDFGTPEKVKITMHQYLDSIIDGTLDTYNVSSRDNGVGMVTIVPHNLYNVRIPDLEGNRLLTEIEQNEYHTITTQCMHTSKRARSDLQTSILFHCTRVQRADTDDQQKWPEQFDTSWQQYTYH